MKSKRSSLNLRKICTHDVLQLLIAGAQMTAMESIKQKKQLLDSAFMNKCVKELKRRTRHYDYGKYLVGPQK